jgi:hypothetical protein
MRVTVSRNHAGPTPSRRRAAIQMPRRKSQIAAGSSGEHDVLATIREGQASYGPGICPRPRLFLHSALLSPLPRTVKQDLGETRFGMDPPSTDSLHDSGREQQGREPGKDTLGNHSPLRSW